VFESNKSHLQPVCFVVTFHVKSSKEFLRYSGLAAQLSAFLLEMFRIILHLRGGIVCANG
jgi:hypothetical protein